MKKYTFSELLEVMQAHGANRGDVALGRMMDDIEDETGTFPNWDDVAPEWVVELCIGA